MTAPQLNPMQPSVVAKEVPSWAASDLFHDMQAEQEHTAPIIGAD
jgi:hypothetical protein